MLPSTHLRSAGAARCPVKGCQRHAQAEPLPLCRPCWRLVSADTKARIRRAFDRGGSFTYAGAAMPTGEWDAAVWSATFEAEAAQGLRPMCTA